MLYHPLSSDIETMNDRSDDDPERTMWQYMSPIAIFASKTVKNSEGRQLMPVAIQMDDNRGKKLG